VSDAIAGILWLRPSGTDALTMFVGCHSLVCADAYAPLTMILSRASHRFAPLVLNL